MVRVDAIALLLLYLGIAFLGGIATLIGQAPGAFPSAVQVGILAFAAADLVAVGLVAMNKGGRVATFAVAMIAAPGVAFAGAILVYM